ncbi:hypothetical protein E05_44040 [Plautia stali symbiont]|nr:hypothetical protein E05_44040 [Plautia stali symbiont]
MPALAALENNGALTLTGSNSIGTRSRAGSAHDATINVLGSGNGIENRAELGNVSLSNLTLNFGDGNGIRTAVAFDPASTVTTNVSGSGNGLTIANAD